MKITLWDVVNKDVDVRKYMNTDSGTNKIFVDGSSLDKVILNKKSGRMKTAYFLSGAIAATVSIFFVVAVQDMNKHDEIMKEWRTL